MAAWGAWLDQNWFNLIQTLGIIGSAWLATATLRRDTQGRKVSDYLSLAGQHRELWSEIHRNPELGRVLQKDVDLIAAPLSSAEAEFLNLAIAHFQSGWLLGRDGGLITLNVLAADAHTFFTFPLVKTVWDQTRKTRDPEFVRFIEKSMKGNAKERGI